MIKHISAEDWFPASTTDNCIACNARHSCLRRLEIYRLTDFDVPSPYGQSFVCFLVWKWNMSYRNLCRKYILLQTDSSLAGWNVCRIMAVHLTVFVLFWVRNKPYTAYSRLHRSLIFTGLNRLYFKYDSQSITLLYVLLSIQLSSDHNGSVIDDAVLLSHRLPSFLCP